MRVPGRRARAARPRRPAAGPRGRAARRPPPARALARAWLGLLLRPAPAASLAPGLGRLRGAVSGLALPLASAAFGARRPGTGRTRRPGSAGAATATPDGTANRRRRQHPDQRPPGPGRAHRPVDRSSIVHRRSIPLVRSMCVLSLPTRLITSSPPASAPAPYARNGLLRRLGGAHDLAVLHGDLAGQPLLLADGQQRLELDERHEPGHDHVARDEEERARPPAQVRQQLRRPADLPPQRQHRAEHPVLLDQIE